MIMCIKIIQNEVILSATFFGAIIPWLISFDLPLLESDFADFPDLAIKIFTIQRKQFAIKTIVNSF